MQRFLTILILLFLAYGAVAQESTTDPNAEDAKVTTEAEDMESKDDEAETPFAKRKAGFGFANPVSIPSTLVGSDRKEVVLDRTTRSLPNNFTGYYSRNFTEDQQLMLEVNLSTILFGADLSYYYQPDGWDGAFGINTSFTTQEFAPFYQGNPDVILPNGEDSYLQRFSTGIEYVHKFNEHFDLATGFNYQNYRFADQFFGGDAFPADNTGRPLAFGPASGDLYTLNLHGRLQNFDDPDMPNEGTQLRFGATQGLEIGARSSSFTRFTANLAHLIKAPGFNDGDHSVLLNVQAGTVSGDPPQVAGFHLGGASSVRGFGQAGMASGTSFFQSTVEYRHYLTDVKLFGPMEGALRGVVFADYGSVLGTQGELAGIPPTLLDRPTDSFGYGFGLQLAGKGRLYRLESGWSGQGDQSVFFVLGERF